MIKTRSLVKDYAGQPALRGVDLDIPKGELCVLLGPSGCGKSTLLKLINALILPTSGDIFIGGKNIREEKPEALRRGIGYVVQSVGLFPHYTVRQNISVVPKLLKWNEKRVKARAEEMLALIDLPTSAMDKYPHELSGGEAQRVGVARALAADPPILLMDEPFGSVDPLGRERLQHAFLDIQQRLHKTVVFVTHDVSEALAMGDRIVLMREGRVVQAGTPREMVLSPGDDFSRAFFGANTALKLLGRFHARQAARPLGQQKAPDYTVDGDLPLSDALSLMLVTGARHMGVDLASHSPMILDAEDLLRFFQEEAQDA